MLNFMPIELIELIIDNLDAKSYMYAISVNKKFRSIGLKYFFIKFCHLLSDEELKQNLNPRYTKRFQEILQKRYQNNTSVTLRKYKNIIIERTEIRDDQIFKIYRHHIINPLPLLINKNGYVRYFINNNIYFVFEWNRVYECNYTLNSMKLKCCSEAQEPREIFNGNPSLINKQTVKWNHLLYIERIISVSVSAPYVINMCDVKNNLYEIHFDDFILHFYANGELYSIRDKRTETYYTMNQDKKIRCFV